jgi:hypothetical protein
VGRCAAGIDFRTALRNALLAFSMRRQRSATCPACKQRADRRPAVPAASVARDNADFRPCRQPRLGRRRLTVGQNLNDAVLFEITDDRPLSVPALKPVVEHLARTVRLQPPHVTNLRRKFGLSYAHSVRMERPAWNVPMIAKFELGPFGSIYKVRRVDLERSLADFYLTTVFSQDLFEKFYYILSHCQHSFATTKT